LEIGLIVKVVEWAGLITDTVLSPLLVTYKLPLAESNAIPCGSNPTGIGSPTTVLFWPDITATLSPETTTTYKFPLAES
jgi:hypothetical protein